MKAYYLCPKALILLILGSGIGLGSELLSISKLVPSSGPLTGLTNVSITGFGFDVIDDNLVIDLEFINHRTLTSELRLEDLAADVIDNWHASVVIPPLPQHNVSRQDDFAALLSARRLSDQEVSNIVPFKLYPTPIIDKIFPNTLKLAGKEVVYIMGENLWPSESSEAKFVGLSSKTERIVKCQFDTVRMRTNRSDGVEMKRRALLCLSPSWQASEKVEVSISLNGQQFHVSKRKSQSIVAFQDGVASILDNMMRQIGPPIMDGSSIHSKKKNHPYNNNSMTDLGLFSRVFAVFGTTTTLHHAASKQYKNNRHYHHNRGSGGGVGMPSSLTSITADHPLHFFEHSQKMSGDSVVVDADRNLLAIARPADIHDLRTDFRLLLDYSTMVLAAALGGSIASLLHMPAALGYLIAGVLISPQTFIPSFAISQSVPLYTFSQLGPAILLFQIGIEFSLVRIYQMRKVICIAGLFPFAIFGAFFAFAALFEKTSVVEGTLIGWYLTLSSTTVCAKELAHLKLNKTTEGKSIVGVLLAQDVTIGFLISVLPQLASHGGVSWLEKHPLINAVFFMPIWGGSHAVGFLLVALFLGFVVLPFYSILLSTVKSRELLLLSVVGLAFGAAIAAEKFDLALELGAFTAGVLLTQLPDEILRSISKLVEPIGQLFSGLFFCSMGLLIDISFVWANLGNLLSLLVVITVLKFFVLFVLFRISGHSWIGSSQVALCLSHIGEFSFLLVGKAHGLSLISKKVHLLLLGTATLSLLLAPFALLFARLFDWGPEMSPTSSPAKKTESTPTFRHLSSFVISKIATSSPGFYRWLLRLSQWHSWLMVTSHRSLLSSLAMNHEDEDRKRSSEWQRHLELKIDEDCI